MTNISAVRTMGAAAGPTPVPEARQSDGIEPFDPRPSTGNLVLSMGFSAFVGVQAGAIAGMLAAKGLGRTGALKAALMVTGGIAGATAGAMFGRHMEYKGRMERHQREVEAVRGPSLDIAARRILKAHNTTDNGSISMGRREGELEVVVQGMPDTLGFEQVAGTNTTKVFDRYDLLAAANADGDGHVDARELTEFLAEFDADHSGSLSPAEGRAVLDRHPTVGVLVKSGGLTPISSLTVRDDDLAGLAGR